MPPSTWLDLALGVGMLVLVIEVVRLRRRLDATSAILESCRRMDLLAPMTLDLAERLERLEARTEPTAATVAAEPPEPLIEPERSSGPRFRLDPAHASTLRGPTGCPTLIEVPSLAAPSPSSTPSELAAELDRRYGPIWGLADAGTAPDEIVRRTGHPIGQVELILGLRRQRPLTHNPPSPSHETAPHG